MAVPTPEQINLQVAGPDTVTVAFVTFEPVNATAAKAQLGTKPDLSDAVTLAGVSHDYLETNTTRLYAMHFVVFRNLKPQSTYYYRVTSGSANAAWSATFKCVARLARGFACAAVSLHTSR
jgi:hypothetical protein